MKKVLNKKGFTLVELMVVVAIMGVLIAVAVPAYNNATAGAESAVCKANMRTYDSAIMQAKMNGDTIENGTLDDANAISQTYMKDGKAVTCPTTKTAYYSLTVDAANNNSWTVACTGAKADEHNDTATDSTP